MELKEILELMAKKYPADYKNGTNPALLIYDDESGLIVRDAGREPYEQGNKLYTFRDIDALVEHLQE